MSFEFEADLKAARRRPLWTPSDTTRTVDHGRTAIERILPHREPFLFVDRITQIDLSQMCLRGRRRLDPADPVFRGHFPGEPLWPGVLQIEAMGQLGLCLMHFAGANTVDVGPDARPARLRATRIHHALFQAAALPGDDLEILGKVLRSDEYTAVCAGQIIRGDTIVSLGIMEVYFVDE